MGRLVGIALAVAAAGIIVIVVVGAGPDKPEERASPASARAQPGTNVGGDAVTPDTRAVKAPVGATIRMRDLAFAPANVTVKVGQAVRFRNDDDVVHAVSEDLGSIGGAAPQFASNRIKPGDDYRFEARAAGEIPYVCTLHPTVMHGVIRVTAAG